MQGKLEKRIDKYGMAKESGFTRNRFTVRNLTMINSWDIVCTIPEILVINLSRDTAWYLGDDIKLHKTGEGKMFTTDRNDTHITNGDDNEEIYDVYKNRIDAKNMPPGIQGGLMASNPEMMGNREPVNTEQLEFKPGRKPKEVPIQQRRLDLLAPGKAQ